MIVVKAFMKRCVDRNSCTTAVLNKVVQPNHRRT